MWQSQIEIKYYSITYFERITKFDVIIIPLLSHICVPTPLPCVGSGVNCYLGNTTVPCVGSGDVLPGQHHCRRATVLCVAMVTGLVYPARINSHRQSSDVRNGLPHAQVNVLRVTKCSVIYYGMHNLIVVLYSTVHPTGSLVTCAHVQADVSAQRHQMKSPVFARLCLSCMVAFLP